MANIRHPHSDPIEQGAQARIHGHPKDACPYPRDSEERLSWMEGYDGTPRDEGPDMLADESNRGAIELKLSQ